MVDVYKTDGTGPRIRKCADSTNREKPTMTDRDRVRVLATGLFLALALLDGAPSLAQRIKSTLSGAVTDASGASIPGVEVALTNEGTNTSASFVTTENGAFTFPFLDPGSYTVKASLPGFKTLVQKGILIRVATDQRVDLRLEVGQVAEQVEVVGQAPLLEHVSSTLGQVVDNKKIVDLPLNGRNIFSLLNTIPGSSLGGAAGSGVTATNPSINGTRPRGNNFTIDGVSANQEYSGFTGGAGVASIPQVDAIGEFKVNTSNYSAEYGRVTGAVVTLGIKSGTNQFHGAVFEFLRNEVLDARNFFASVGGPIRRDKLFFFSDVEWTRRRSTSVSTQTVPTLAMRSGDFSADSTPIYDPATTQVEGGKTVRSQFPGNIIPADRIDAVARRLTEFWPAPNGPGLVSNYLSASSTGANVARHDTKIDYTLSAHDALSGRFSYFDNEVIGASTFPGPANPNLTAYQRIKAPGFQANYTRTFSPRLLNEFRVGWQRNRMAVSGEKSSYDDWRRLTASSRNSRLTCVNFAQASRPSAWARSDNRPLNSSSTRTPPSTSTRSAGHAGSTSSSSAARSHGSTPRTISPALQPGPTTSRGSSRACPAPPGPDAASPISFSAGQAARARRSSWEGGYSHGAPNSDSSLLTTFGSSEA